MEIHKFKVVYRYHAMQRMVERNISKADIQQALTNGEIIKTYPDDKPLPSLLVLGKAGTRFIHIVAALDRQDNSLIIISAYEPDKVLWWDNFKTRKKP